MKKFTFYIVMIFCCIVNLTMAQNIGISPNGSTPHPSAGLDVNFADRGLLIPRVSLVNTTSASPVTEPAVSLLVYNTATTGNVTPGYYFWNGTAWSRLSGSLSGIGTANYLSKWTGSGTFGSSQVFDNGTNVGIGTATPGAKLEVAGRIWQTSTGGSILIGEGAGANEVFDEMDYLYCVSIGSFAGNNNNIGHYNIAIGLGALFSNIDGWSNTTVGSNSLWQSNGWENTAIGSGTLGNDLMGMKNTGIGSEANVGSGGLTNATAIGSNALVNANNSMVLGSISGINGATSSVNVGIGTTTPSARLDIIGNVKITDGTQGANRVLTSDANGLASWQIPSSLGWFLTGNAGSIAGTNFIGTTDNQSLDIRTNNIVRLRITANGGLETLYNGENVFLGEGAGGGGYQGGQYNTLVGYLAGNQNSIGNFNTANGSYALSANTQGAGNVAIGSRSLYSNTTGLFNTAQGMEAMYSNITGGYNTAVGLDAIFSNTTGFANTASGYGALFSNTTGNSNTASGSWTLSSNDEGNNNSAFGDGADVGSGNLTNATAIGSRSMVGASNSLVLGSIAGVNYALSSVNVGIGTTTPSARLDVVGSFKITDGSEGLDKVLTSDANGLASWQNSDMTQLASTASACYQLSGSAETGTNPLSIAVLNNYAYVVNETSNTLQIFDVSTLSSPSLVGSVGTGIHPRSVAVSGDYAYVVNNGSNSLQVFNVSTPSSPSLAGSISTDSEPMSVAVSGNFAYVVNFVSNSLQIFNISTPSSPSLAGSAVTGSAPNSVAVSGNYAYVVNYSGNSMQVFNVSTPSSPSQESIVGAGSFPTSVAVSGNYAYVVNFVSNTLLVFNVNTPSDPVLESSVGTGDNPASVTASGNYVYVANNGSHTMQIFNASAPSSPSLAGSLSTGLYPSSIAVSGNYAYVVNAVSNSLQIFENTCPQQNLIVENGNMVWVSPSWQNNNEDIYNANTGNVGIGETNPTAKLDVAGTVKITDGTQGVNKVLTSDVNGLASWQNSELTQLASNSSALVCYQTVGEINADNYPVSLAVSANYVFVVNEFANSMQVINVSNPSNPSLTSSIETEPNPLSIAISGNYAYVLGNSGSFQIFNISNPSSPSLAGSLIIGSNPLSFAVSGNYAYVVNYPSNSLQILDVSNPSNPSLAGSVGTGSYPISVAVAGNYAYVVNFLSSSLQIFNVSNPSNPSLASSVGTGSYPNSVAVSANYAYVTGGSNSLQIFDVSNPSSPSLAGSVSTDPSPASLAVSGNHAFVVSWDTYTLQIFNVSTPSNSNLVGSAGLEPGSFPVAVSGNYAYVASITYNSLQILQNTCPQTNIIIENGQIVSAMAPWQNSGANIYCNISGNVGIGTMTPGDRLDVMGGNIRTNQQMISTVATGTAPLSVSSTTLVSNLNADLLDGQHSSEFAPSSGSVNYIRNQTSTDQAAGFRINGNGIFNGGKIGIGTTNPAGNLQIDNTGDVTVALNADTDNNAGGEADNPRIELIQDGGGVVGALGLTGSNDALHVGDIQNAFYIVEEYNEGALQFGTNNQIKMTILPNGYVGIGTNAPKSPLHISVYTATTPFSSTSVTYNKHVPSSSQANLSGGLNSVNSLVSLIAEGDIICKGTLTIASAIYFSSDKRLKDISGISNSMQDLDILKKIQVTDYTMKDRVTWGFASYKKAIAQQVEEVYPQAVTQTTGYVPDIYEFASKVEKTDAGFMVTMNKSLNCKVGDKIRLELENKGTVEADVVNVLNEKQIEVVTETDISAGELFVYGLQVNDLRTVDYDAISMLNVSATQELAKQLKEAQDRIEELQNQNEELKAQIGEIREFLGMKADK
jgi:hypothetical protein